MFIGGGHNKHGTGSRCTLPKQCRPPSPRRRWRCDRSSYKRSLFSRIRDSQMHYLTGPEITVRQHPVTVSDLCGVEPLRDGQAHQVIFVKVELEQDVQPPARRPPHAAGSNIGWGPVASCPWPACEAIIRRPAGVPARSMYHHVCGPGMTRLIAPSAAGVRHRRSNVLSTSGETQKGPRKKTRRGRPMTIAAKGTQRMPLLSPRSVANPSSAPTFRQPRGCKRPH